jgi:Fe-S cluster assembly ATP-binding protein
VGREVNEGFSGGEKKRLELLQLLLLQPKLAILDEIDSGMDVQGRQKVREIVSEMQSKGTAFLVITHYDDLLEKDQITRTQTMKHGRV